MSDPSFSQYLVEALASTRAAFDGNVHRVGLSATKPKHCASHQSDCFNIGSEYYCSLYQHWLDRLRFAALPAGLGEIILERCNALSVHLCQI